MCCPLRRRGEGERVVPTLAHACRTPGAAAGSLRLLRMVDDDETSTTAPGTAEPVSSGQREVFGLLVNANGGSANGDRIAAARTALDEAAAGHRLYEFEGDPTQTARRALGDGCTTLVACGGDGSVSAVAAVVVEAGITLGVVPMGTLNHFAKDLGIPDDPTDAVGVLVAGHRRQVDVGMAGDVLFVNNASVGSYARLVAHRERLQEQMSKPRATLSAMRQVFPHRPTPIDLDVDGERISILATLVFFGNNEYVVQDGRFTRASLDDGLISVYALHAERKRDLLRIAFRIARDRIGREHDLVHRTGSRITLTTPGATTLFAHDGEVDPIGTPLQIASKPGALTVLAPRPVATDG
jgi:diacylglycerol kinase family enzyme